MKDRAAMTTATLHSQPSAHPTPRWRAVACAVGWVGAFMAAPSVQAQSLQALFDAAQGYDATYLSALAQYQANQARAAQARAGVLPNVGLSAGANWTHTDSSLPGQDRTTNAQNLGWITDCP